MRAVELKVPPLYVPVTVSELALPGAPADPETVNVVPVAEFAAIVPKFRGSGDATDDPIFTLISVTLVALLRPLFASVSCKVRSPLRLSTLVTKICGLVLLPAFTAIVVVRLAISYVAVSVGVNFTDRV